MDRREKINCLCELIEKLNEKQLSHIIFLICGMLGRE